MPKVKFAIVVEGEVAATISVQENTGIQEAERGIAAYRSNPKIVEVTDPNINSGWTWDGTNFYPPLGGN